MAPISIVGLTFFLLEKCISLPEIHYHAGDAIIAVCRLECRMAFLIDKTKALFFMGHPGGGVPGQDADLAFPVPPVLPLARISASSRFMTPCLLAGGMAATLSTIQIPGTSSGIHTAYELMRLDAALRSSLVQTISSHTAGTIR